MIVCFSYTNGRLSIQTSQQYFGSQKTAIAETISKHLSLSPPLSVSALPFHLACLRLSYVSVEELETLAAGTMPRTYHTVDRLFQARSKDQEIMSREVELDLQVSPEEIMSREVELGCESWTSFASNCSSTAMQRTLSL